MHVFYRMMIDFIDESPIEEIKPIINEFDDEDEEDDVIYSWSMAIILDENNRVKTIRKYSGKKEDEFFNSMIRASVDDYKHISRFDHFKWIIEECKNNRVFLLASYWDESMRLEDFLNNLKEQLAYSYVQVKNLQVQEIEHNEYFESHAKSMKNGSLECSTAWMDEAGRYDYIHELYEDND